MYSTEADCFQKHSSDNEGLERKGIRERNKD